MSSTVTVLQYEWYNATNLSDAPLYDNSSFDQIPDVEIWLPVYIVLYRII